MPESQRLISVIVPVHNEAANVPKVAREVEEALRAFRFELVFVDDGSTDQTIVELEKLSQSKDHVRFLELARNYGQSAALDAGIKQSLGEIVVTLDGDLQNDPADIPRMIAKLDEGFEVVNGWRQQRAGSWWRRRLPSTIANWLIGRIVGSQVRDNGCGLKVFDRTLASELQLYGDGHRMILAQAHHLGARIIEVPITDRPRLHGQSKYGLSRTYKVILDLIALQFMASQGTKPIRLIGGTGLAMVVSAFTVALGLLIWRLGGGGFIVQSPLTMLAGVLLIVGVQLILLGLVAELIVRLYQHSDNTVPYRIRRHSQASSEHPPDKPSLPSPPAVEQAPSTSSETQPNR